VALLAVILAAGAILGGNAVASGAGSDERATPTALVIDASLGRDGRELVDARLKDVDAAVRLPRNATEARTNVGYLNALGYRVVVAGPDATAAADGTGVGATRVAGLGAALAEAR